MTNPEAIIEMAHTARMIRFFIYGVGIGEIILCVIGVVYWWKNR